MLSIFKDDPVTLEKAVDSALQGTMVFASYLSDRRDLAFENEAKLKRLHKKYHTLFIQEDFNQNPNDSIGTQWQSLILPALKLHEERERLIREELDGSLEQVHDLMSSLSVTASECTKHERELHDEVQISRTRLSRARDTFTSAAQQSEILNLAFKQAMENGDPKEVDELNEKFQRAVQNRLAADQEYRAELLRTNSKLNVYYKDALPDTISQLQGGEMKHSFLVGTIKRMVQVELQGPRDEISINTRAVDLEVKVSRLDLEEMTERFVREYRESAAYSSAKARKLNEPESYERETNKLEVPSTSSPSSSSSQHKKRGGSVRARAAEASAMAAEAQSTVTLERQKIMEKKMGDLREILEDDDEDEDEDLNSLIKARPRKLSYLSPSMTSFTTSSSSQPANSIASDSKGVSVIPKDRAPQESCRLCASTLVRMAGKFAKQAEFATSGSGRAQRSFNDLPIPLQLYILSHLPMPEIAKLALISRKFQEHALDPDLWHEVIQKNVIEVEQQRFSNTDDYTRPINRWHGAEDSEVEVEADTMKEWKHIISDANYRKRNGKRVLELIRLGIPHDIRRDMWPILTQSNEMMKAHPNLYRQLSLSQMAEDQEREILQDVSRTLPELPVYMQEKGKNLTHAKSSSLFRVLKAYAVYDPAVGYTQGANFIVAILLMYLSEEEAFWMLVLLMDQYEYREMVLPGFPGVVRHLWCFQTLLQDMIPALATHFADIGISSPMYATQWFITLFASSLSTSVSARIWDIFLIKSWRTVHQVGLSLLRLHEEELLKCDFEEALRFLMNIGRDYESADSIVKAMHILKVTSKDLKRLKKDFEKVGIDNIEDIEKKIDKKFSGMRQAAGRLKMEFRAMKARKKESSGSNSQSSSSRKEKD